MEASAAVDPGPSDLKHVGRRLVQSTLFPPKPREEKDEDCDRKGERDCLEAGEDEEYCVSQGRRKKYQKRKAASQSRSSKKVAVNGKETSSEAMDGRDSPDELHPRTRKVKKQAPVKNGRNSSIKGTCWDKISTNRIVHEQVSQLIPDLRLEAKMTTEENSRIFAGRQLHPFFSTWKAGKKNQEVINGKSNWPLSKKDKDIRFGPIHVFENVKDDLGSIDWSNWTFYDEIFGNTSYDQGTISSTTKGMVDSLHFDDLHKVSNPSRISNLLQEISSNHYPDAQEDMSDIQTAGSSVLVDLEVAQNELLKYMKVDYKVGQFGFISGDAGCMRSGVEKQNATLQERIAYYLSRNNQPENSLWTCKYQPENALEVCGNSEAVGIINEWLHLWHERHFPASKKFLNDEKSIVQEGDYDCFDSSSDAENMEDTAGLKNVLLVMGPVGSGKSAAIYACAKEQGFQVTEVNASDWRNGALVKQKFGEAVGSHWLKRRQENPIYSQRKQTAEASAEELDQGRIDTIPLSEEEDSNNAVEIPQKFYCGDDTVGCGEGEIKTLILFEDVDATLSEDRGFISTIHQLADTGKRPMILTTNSNNPVLPENLDREEVYFTKPSSKELLSHVNMVCMAEKANIQPHIIERYIQYCKGDVRKTLMHLQFWCQGKGNGKGSPDVKVRSLYMHLPFDLEAGHYVLPKVIPWDFPSQLSEVVERQIAQSLCRMEENSFFEMTGEELGNHNMKNLDVCKGGPTSVEAKKEEIFSRNVDCEDGFMASVINACELSNSSGSPVAFNRRSGRKNFGTVLSSGSEDEISIDEFLAVSDLNKKHVDDVLFSEVDSQLQMHHPVDSAHPTTDTLPLAGYAEVEELQQKSGAMKDPLINDQCQSVDVSCVPESTFVPETQVNFGTELISRTHPSEAVSPIIVDNANQSVSGLHEDFQLKQCPCFENVNLVDEEIGDSLRENDHRETSTRGYPVMDECSRVDFSRGSKRLKKPWSRIVENSVQETWNKLRITDLRQHITLDQKNASQAVELTYRISNLISEADLLLHNCQLLCSDSSEQDIDLSGETLAFGRCDQQVQMTSDVANHGFCLYAKDIAVLASKMGMASEVDLTREMLASTSNSMALENLLVQSRAWSQTSFAGNILKISSPTTDLSYKCEKETVLHNIIQSIVPSRLYLALKGCPFHEYLSSLACISRSEASRLSQNTESTTRRRVRVAKNYLTGGALSLSPDNISVLLEQCSYGKGSSRSTDQFHILRFSTTFHRTFNVQAEMPGAGLFLRQLSGKDGCKSTSRRWNGQRNGNYGSDGGIDERNWKQMEGIRNMYEYGDNDGLVKRKRVMVVVDRSSRSKHAMMWALTHVINKSDLLTLLHIIPPPQNGSSERTSDSFSSLNLASALGSLCKACKPEVEVEALVIQGPKLATVLSQVKKLEVSVLVLGQKKPSAITNCLFGISSTEGFEEQCINSAECLTVGLRRQSKGMGGYLISTRWQKNFWLLA
ncbi:hypothetical protein Nepgr_023683 [Nepenthes gracilis]|uniref:UspA domain-containing protein n=2 Tax=Pentapetalae TaxID=1437201 RepID=A0AAD3XZC0_NEPGR|nr:hypothetical protein Nepgr_023683 [Nepenthes gracilis]